MSRVEYHVKKGYQLLDSPYYIWYARLDSNQRLSAPEAKNIVQLDVDRLRLKMLKKRCPQTVKHVLSLLRRVINFGVQKQLCEGLGFKIEMPSVDNVKTEDLTPEQMEKLLRTIEKDDHPIAGQMMKMALFTGMRRGEMF